MRRKNTDAITRSDKGSKVIGHGGPALEIGLEYAEENSNRRRPENLQAIRDKSSPYEVFRSSTGVLGVTDITGPAWQDAVLHST